MLRTVSIHSTSTSNRDVETYRHGLATLAAELYALESMTYLTAGISDSYENPKIDVETAIVKSFSLDLIAHALELILSFPAASFGIKGHPCEEYIRNSSQLSLAWRAEAENLKIHIGLAGLQHCDVCNDRILRQTAKDYIFLSCLTEYQGKSCEKSHRFSTQLALQGTNHRRYY